MNRRIDSESINSTFRRFEMYWFPVGFVAIIIMIGGIVNEALRSTRRVSSHDKRFGC